MIVRQTCALYIALRTGRNWMMAARWYDVFWVGSPVALLTAQRCWDAALLALPVPNFGDSCVRPAGSAEQLGHDTLG